MSNRAVLVSTEDHFQDLIDGVDFTGVPHVALFTAPAWCIPCRRFEPHWEKAQDSLPNHFFIKVDMGEKPEDTGAHWATKRFSILGVPTVKLWVATEPTGSVAHDIKARAVVPFVREVESYA